MQGIRLRLLRNLKPHGFCTGTQIGAALGLTRAAIHKHVQALVRQGVPIHRVPGRGYRLAEGVVLLDEGVITEGLSQRARVLVGGLDVLDEVDSTSAEMARTMDFGSSHYRVCLAEKQTAGRGRRGRAWIASPYRDLMMSVGVEYPQWPAQLPALGLVTALSIVDALEGLGIQELAVKWPNDVVCADRKLCGVLLDVTGETHGACRVIVGIGINVSMKDDLGRSIDQRWVDLDAIAGRSQDRNTVAAEVLNVLLPVFESFPETGFAGYRSEWRRRDALHGRRIVVRSADGKSVEGEAAGVDGFGRLQVMDARGQAHAFTQGDVNVRVR